jgi:hypothetical protein
MLLFMSRLHPRVLRPLFVPFACGVLVTWSAVTKAASIDCSSATNVPNPVYIAGSTTAKPFIQNLAKALGSSVSLIYAPEPACNGLDDVLASPAQQEDATPSFASPTKGFLTCTNAGTTYPAFNVDIGLSDVYATSCIAPQLTVGTGYADWLGPIQAFEFVVPWTSSEFSISADAAYVVFGYAAQNYVVTPWNDPTAIWTRGDTAAAQLILGQAIGLSAAKWLSTASAEAGAAQILPNATAMATTIAGANATKPNSTIGILGSSSTDPLKSAPGVADGGAPTGGIKPLAFQAIGQDCGYYADSNLSTYDKINVRQGRYSVWGPLHFVTSVDGSGNPTVNPQASQNLVPSVQSSVETVINAITHKGLTNGSTPTLQAEIVAEANASFIPECAMQVQRTSELGAEASYQPALGCGCYFESLTGGGNTLSSYCTTCAVDADCADAGGYSHCNFGYCEAQ